MAEVEIVEARPEHIPWVVAHIRPEDEAECVAAGQESVAAALHDGIRRSTRAWTSFVDGVPTTIGGVAPVTILGDRGIPWMLATRDVERVPRHVLREGRRHVAIMASEFPELVNWVDARNEKAIRWLRWLGFRIDEPRPYGPYGVAFRRFTLGV